MSGGPGGEGRRIGSWEIGASVLLLLLGGYMIIEGISYGVGNFRRMGPGFFPVSVGGLLVALAIGILVELRKSGGETGLHLPWRALGMLTAALIVFAVTVEPLGVVPSTVLLVLIGSFADPSMTGLRAAASAAVLAVLGYAVFVLGFGLPLNPFWW